MFKYTKAVQNKMSKALDKHCGADADVAFGVDKENDSHYIWDCEFEGKSFKVLYNKETKKVEIY